MVIWIFLKLQKNQQNEKILTLSKPEKLNELWPYIKKQIDIDNQVFLDLSVNRRVDIFRLFFC